MVGADTARLTGESSTGGSLAVDCGTVELPVAWTNATNISVAEGGRLVVTASRAFPKKVSLSLKGVGALSLPAGSTLRVGSLTLTNPSTGEVKTQTSGLFDSANTWGIVAEGNILVGKTGLILIVK